MMLAHVGLAVADLDRSIRFYSELFGFRVSRRLSLGHAEIDPLLRLDRPSDLEAVYLVLGDFTLELLRFSPAATATAASRTINQTGLTHLALVRAGELAPLVERAEALGGTLLTTSGTAVMLRDPDGQLIEVLAPDYPARVAAAAQARDDG